MVCADGRARIADICEMPLGIVQSYPNIGARFNLEWPRFQTSVQQLWEHVRRHDRSLVWIVADHFSRSNAKFGCKGHEHSAEKAKASSRALKAQFEDLFAEESSRVFVIHVSIETDEDVLIFHGENGEEIDLGRLEDVSKRNIRHELRKLYHRMQGRIFAALVELALGNVRHFQRIRRSKRSTEEMDHAEWVLAVGMGCFDYWLCERNMALVLVPHDPNLDHWIEVAAKLISENVHRKGFVKSRGAVLVVSAQFDPKEGSVGKKIAEHKAAELAERTVAIIQRKVPSLMDHLGFLTITVNVRDHTMHILDGK